MKKVKIRFIDSLGFILLFWFLVISLVPLSIVSYNNYFITVEGIKKSANHELRQLSSITKKFITNWFYYRKVDIANWSQRKINIDFMYKLDKEYKASAKTSDAFIKSKEYKKIIHPIENSFLFLSKEYDYIYDLFMIDSDGNILYTVAKEKDLGTNLFTGKYALSKFSKAFQSTMKDGKIHFSDLELYEPSKHSVAGFFTAPLLDKSGNIIGVFAVQIKLDRIYTFFDDVFSNKNIYRHYLVGEDGLLRSKISSSKDILKFMDKSKQFSLWNKGNIDSEVEKINNEGLVSNYVDPLGNEVLGLYQSINIFGIKWVLISEVSKDEIFYPILKTRNHMVVFFITIMILVVLISLLITRRITQPIRDLSSAMLRFSNGQENIDLNVQDSGEIGHMSLSFNEMVHSLKLNEDKLKKQTAEANKALNELKQQKFVLDSHSIVAITDVKGNITFVNDKFVEISGYTREELIGKNHRLLNSGLHGREFWHNMYKTVSSGKVWSNEVCNIAKNGRFYWVDTTIVAFMDENEKPKSYIAIRTDITDKKASESKLIEANELALESVKAKSEFLASMSHEIRTPMNGIIGMIGLLMNTKLNKSQMHKASLIQTSAKLLLNLINDILDFSKVEAGKMDLEYINFNLRNELGNFVESIAFKAEEKGVELILDTTEVEYTMINADQGRIRQILSNIVGNSIKFTSSGYILIKVALKVEDGENARLLIEVSDSGIGIPEDKIDILFKSFSQVDASTTRKYGGTGLGLAIVKKLCELMDGTVKVKSEYGHGSTFSMDLSVNFDAKSSLVIPSALVSGKKVLIIDNSEVSIHTLEGQLRHWDMEVYSCQTIKQALLILETRNIDILFLNIELSNLETSEFRQLIEKNNMCKNMKVAIITNFTSSNLSANPHYKELNSNSYISKPITTRDILQTLDVLMENNNDVDSTNSISMIEEETQVIEWDYINILLVEDNITNQLVANGILEEFGLEADVANNGIEALKILNSSDKEYDLIFMDCQMPEMDGYETTKAIRNGKAKDSYRKVPIVAMTANAMQGDKEKCEASGMDDYITKPIDTSSLKAVLRKYLLDNS